MTRNARATIISGAWRFTLVSVAGFAPWITAGGWFYRTVGEIGLYVACLVGFLLAALLLLHGLLTGEARLRRTVVWFLPAFTAYAVVWCGCWFAFGGRLGEWSGALGGGTIFVLVSAWALGRPRLPLITTLVFLIAPAAGYFGGDWIYRLFAQIGWPTSAGMLAWSLCYGLGFGAGLGWLVHACRPLPALDNAR